MAIRDIFKMIKADRYTQDGREELIKAQEAVTEDVTYKPGDISRKTGLQKQPDGSWAPVKNAPAQKKSVENQKTASSLNKAKSAVVEKLRKEGLSDPQILEHEEYKKADKALSDFMDKATAEKSAPGWRAPGSESDPNTEGSIAWYAQQAKKSPSASSDWKSDLVSKLDTEKLKQMDNDFKEFEKSGRNISPEAKERNDLVKAELAKRKESASGSAPSMTSEQRKKWEAKASNPSETKASLTNFINSMENSESFKKANPHAQEIIDIYKTELKKREDNANYRPEKVYSDAPSELKIQGMSKEEYIPWRMKTYKENEAQASSVWNHFAEQQKNKGKENEYDPDFHPLRDSAPRILTGDCKVRIKKTK